MDVLEGKLRLHKRVYPTAQRYEAVAEQVGIDRIDHAGDVKAFALELLIGCDGIALIAPINCSALASNSGAAGAATLPRWGWLLDETEGAHLEVLQGWLYH